MLCSCHPHPGTPEIPSSTPPCPTRNNKALTQSAACMPAGQRTTPRPASSCCSTPERKHVAPPGTGRCHCCGCYPCTAAATPAHLAAIAKDVHNQGVSLQARLDGRQRSRVPGKGTLTTYVFCLCSSHTAQKACFSLTGSCSSRNSSNSPHHNRGQGTRWGVEAPPSTVRVDADL